MAAIDLEASGENEIISRQDIEAAMAKAVELRALHASLMQQGKCSSASPLSRHASYFSAQDYPVFTPSYEDDDALAVYGQSEQENHPQSWKEYNLDATNIDETISSEYRTANASSRKGYIHKAAEDDNSFVGSCSNNNHYSKSRRSSLGDIESVSSCNKWRKPPVAASNDNSRKSNIVVPLTDSHSSLHPSTRNKGLSSLSWLFPRLKKKSKSENSPQHHEQVSRMLDELGMVSMETLKRELMEAQESRDAALVEAAEMKKSLGDLNQKLEYLESYCEEMKKALKQAVHVKSSTSSSSLSTEKLVSLSKREKSGNPESSIPVSGEVMIEGFLQIVSEARLSVKQFCKTLVAQIEETDHTLLHNLNSLLQQYNLSLNSKYSKAVVYHLEAIINQSLYQDFENCVFQKNGTPKLLDRQQECQARFQLFVALRNLSWNEVLRKGTKYYSDEFSRFCDQKMSGIIVALGWTRPWPEQLLQAFFVAGKCIWLLHLLAFSFNPALSILRVEENKAFDAHYMEDIFASKQRERGQGASRVKMMVMPGFYMHHHQVLRCKVLCTYKPVA